MWEASQDPHYAVKKAWVEHVSAIRRGEVTRASRLEVIFCMTS